MESTIAAWATRARQPVLSRPFAGSGPFLHDLRRSFASGLQRLGVAPHIVELALNHRSGTFSGVVGIYQRHRYAKEVRKAFELWSQHIATLIGKSAIAA